MFTPYDEEKVWGTAFHLFASPHAAVSCLRVKAGTRCSRHRHRDRANLFAVQTGCIVVEEWPEGLRKRKRMTVLSPGNTHTVGSGVWHRFRVLRSGKVVEVYWADRGGLVSIQDIERKDVGGQDDLEKLRREVEKMC